LSEPSLAARSSIWAGHFYVRQQGRVIGTRATRSNRVAQRAARPGTVDRLGRFEEDPRSSVTTIETGSKRSWAKAVALACALATRSVLIGDESRLAALNKAARVQASDGSNARPPVAPRPIRRRAGVPKTIDRVGRPNRPPNCGAIALSRFETGMTAKKNRTKTYRLPAATAEAENRVVVGSHSPQKMGVPPTVPLKSSIPGGWL